MASSLAPSSAAREAELAASSSWPSWYWACASIRDCCREPRFVAGPLEQAAALRSANSAAAAGSPASSSTWAEDVSIRQPEHDRRGLIGELGTQVGEDRSCVGEMADHRQRVRAVLTQTRWMLPRSVPVRRARQEAQIPACCRTGATRHVQPDGRREVRQAEPLSIATACSSASNAVSILERMCATCDNA